jgi:hypothetical protein
MLTVSSRAWPFWLAFCCCVALIQGAQASRFNSEDDTLSTNKGRVCRNQVKSEGETDVDCGGVSCPKCEDWKSCNSNCDCISGVCSNRECRPLSSCEDDIKNQDETDVDCGGNNCPRCKDSKTCKKSCDCVTGVCENNKCGRSNGLCFADDDANSEPILLITFGSGTPQYATYAPSKYGFTTTYKQRTQPATDDGYFSFVNSIPDDFSSAWHVGAKDHTGNAGGYMFLVNADYSAGQFFNRTVKNLCVGERYEFSVYLTNICKPTGDKIKPNVLFQIRTAVGNELLGELNSGEVPEHNTLIWKKYGISFKATTSSIVLLMTSHTAGGMGNDLALDDIALRPCGQSGSGVCRSNQ